MKRIVFLIGLLLAGPAYALDCDNAITQTDMSHCAALRYEQADAVLNKTYQALMKNLDAAKRAKLKDAQTAWIQYRDLQCAYNVSNTEGGTAYPMVLSDCRAELTHQQTEMLEAQLNCPEGDLGCTR